MALERGEPLPLHYQITSDLRQAIKAGKWGVGELFPTDKELMENYGVSSTTVRRAVSELVHEGWLERIRGKGTFVRKEAVEEKLERLTGFFEEVKSRGLKPGADVISIRPIDLTQEVVKKNPQLSVFGEQRMLLIERVQKINDNPVVYVKSFWPWEYGNRLTEFDLTKEAFYEIAENELKLKLTNAEQTISAEVAHRKVAKYLDVPMGAPLLIMERVLYSDGKPVEFAVNIYRSDRYKYRVVLERNQDYTNGIILTMDN
ncbi:MAG: GntR family transcriptional regulator [Dehalobacterium sp.]